MGMGSGGSGKKGRLSEINVTPLVDVMLVLLIIIMIIAPLLQQGVALTLPIAINSSEKPETPEDTTVAITNDGRFHLNGIVVPEGDLGRRVEDALDEAVPVGVVGRGHRVSGHHGGAVGQRLGPTVWDKSVPLVAGHVRAARALLRRK